MTAAELATSIAERLGADRLSQPLIRELQRDLGLLYYLLEPKLGWAAGTAPVRGSPICAVPGCKTDWRSGLLNYARPGNDPVWYCLEHGMPAEVGGHSVPGTLPDPAVAFALAKEMSGRWNARLALLEARAEAQPQQQPELAL